MLTIFRIKQNGGGGVTMKDYITRPPSLSLGII